MVEPNELQNVEDVLSENSLHVRELVLQSYKDIGLCTECYYEEFFKELESRYLDA